LAFVSDNEAPTPTVCPDCASIDLRFQRVFAFVSRLTWLDQGRKAENVFSPNDYAAIIRMPIIKRAVPSYMMQIYVLRK